MSSMIVIFLAAMGAIFGAERLFESYESLRWALDLGGLGAIGLSVWLRARARAAHSDKGVREGHRRVLLFTAVAVAGLALYGVSTRGFVELVGFEDEMALRWRGVLGSLWPVLWMIGTIPALAIDFSITSSPIVMPVRRVQHAMNNGLAAALGVCLLFPVNYLGSRHTQEWDFSYFQTSKPGTATRAIAQSLKEPVTVRIFQPTSSEVLPKIQQYFADLDSPNLRLEVLDQAAEPKLSRYLKVSNNGYIAFTQGEVNVDESDASKRPSTQLVNVGWELKKARRKLKKLDEKVQKALMSLARGRLTAYVTQGHGELSWKKGTPGPSAMQGVKQLLEIYNFKLKKLTLADGLGEDVPEGADVVLILGPHKPFLPSEVESLERYLDRGGALLLALEPKQSGPALVMDDGLGPLLTKLGVKRGDGVLTSTQRIVAISRNKIDRLNITTSNFGSHPSTRVLADGGGMVFASIASEIVTLPNSDAKVTRTVRTAATTWADKNGDLEYNTGVETKKARSLMVASEGGKGANAWRALVSGDGTMFSDLAIVVGGNQQLLSDGLNWLTKAEGLSGTTESEDDIKIQHTKEGQAGWFYATVVGFPALILVFGLIRTRRRKSRGES